MLSEQKRGKFTHYFRLLDRDQDGVLEREDFSAIARTAAGLRGVSFDDPAFEALETVVMLTWAHTQDFVDTNGDGKVTVEEWYQTLESTIGDEEKYAVYVTPFAVGLFDLLDGDSDGVIGLEEYRGFLTCFGSGENDAAAVFACLDINGDGAISKDEALALVREFHMSDDADSPGNLLFGRYDFNASAPQS